MKTVDIKWFPDEKRYKVLVGGEIIHTTSRKARAITLAIPHLGNGQLLTYIGCKPNK